MSCCNNDNNTWNCNNPCSTGSANTAACENLASSLDNFITHFFGAVIKTEVNGRVTWSLPCSLDVGLQNNPRAADEGLACYFLRLFDEGILGATGPQGPAGNNGADGFHAFSVTLESFTHPAVGGNVTVKMSANPAISAGQTVFVATSGWYDVQAISGDFTVVMTLLAEASGAGGTVTPGKQVTVTGPRGIQGTQGPQGPQGVQGPAGADGDEFTPTNFFALTSGADHTLTLAIAQVVFGGTEPEVTLPTIGRYQVTFDVGIEMDATAAAAPGEEITLRVWNATAGAYETDLDVTVKQFLPSQVGRIICQAIIATSVANETLQLNGSIATSGKGKVQASTTKVSYVKLSN